MNRTRCKASGCECSIPPAMQFCARHWGAIPSHIRQELRRHERAADALGEDVSDHRPWLAVFHDALAFLAMNEGRTGASRYHDRMARLYRQPVAEATQ